jgi:hypothetical protein
MNRSDWIDQPLECSQTSILKPKKIINIWNIISEIYKTMSLISSMLLVFFLFSIPFNMSLVCSSQSRASRCPFGTTTAVLNDQWRDFIEGAVTWRWTGDWYRMPLDTPTITNRCTGVASSPHVLLNGGGRIGNS